jgi:DNA (cytosine-5)-methyltransferase 1
MRVASFFSGIGGMDLGATGDFEFDQQYYRPLGTKVVFATDFDKNAAEVYAANFDNELVVADIRDLKPEDVPDHDILTGGFPCQSFSVAATNPPRLGYKDLRGQLFFEMIRMLKAHKPRAFIAENVKGLLSANGGTAFPLVLKEFEDAGYKVHYQILNASHFGVPQKRERVFLVGFRDPNHAQSFRFPVGEPSRARPLSIALDSDAAVNEKFFFSDRAVRGMRTTKNSRLMNKGRAQDPDRPCNTVGAHLAKVSLNSTDPVFLDKGRFRMFTPREVARIQSFPDSFGLPGSRSALYRGLGNAVAPVVMWHVTAAVLAALGRAKTQELQEPTIQ